jgi:quinol monooxygenase YgiN
MSLVVVATVKAKPESVDAVAAAYAEFAPRVHDEDGCEMYAVHSNRDGVYLVEKWRDGDALRAHAEGGVVKQIRARIADHVTGPPEAVIMRPYPGSPGPKGSI